MRSIREDNLGASTFIEKGWHMIALGDYAGAEAVLLKALALAPSDNQARALMGWAQMRQGKYDQALQRLGSVLAVEPMNALARANLGYVCLQKGLLREAEDHLSRATRQIRDPKAALYAWFYLGMLHSSTRNAVEAQHCFEKSISLAPNFLEAHYELGRLHWSMNEIADAERVWKCAHNANRFSIWGRRCGEALKQMKAGEAPRSFS